MEKSADILISQISSLDVSLTNLEEKENKIKSLEEQLSVYRIEADKKLTEKDELTKEDLEKLKEDTGDKKDIHYDCKKQIKILTTQNVI